MGTLILSSGQSNIKGTVTDGEGNPLPEASVTIKSTGATALTDADGKYSIESPNGTQEIVIEFIGLGSETREINVTGDINLGAVTLSNAVENIGEVVLIGKGLIDLAKDRKTPIAVSTITKAEIQEKFVGNVEFSEIMKNMPSVYVSNQSGGFGDSQMFVRGFNQSNTAFLLNGQPINGMEDGKIYWSNWAGLPDIANAVQVQRGLGSSKLAISSVGGTTNILIKTTEKKQGGFGRFLVGNDSYFKGTVSYDTGMGEKGWAFSFLLDYWQAHAKYAKGTKGQGRNYFFSMGKKLGDHNFNFLITGAPQWHDKNYAKSKELYDKYGIKYNNNYGFKNGKYLTLRKNYYHKPVMNLNWDWDISHHSSLSTVLYASFGRGGETGAYGSGINYIDNGIDSKLQKGAYTQDGLIDWDYIVEKYNPSVKSGFSTGRNGTMLRTSVNNHAWYGSVINYENTALKNLTFNLGADFRFYNGDHFRQLIDLLGLRGRKEKFNENPNYTVFTTFRTNPWSALWNYADKDERVNYDYSENINYQGGFGQVEWANNQFSVYFQGAVSNQSYKREDRAHFAQPKESNTTNRTGYNIKGGASYTFLKDHSFFINTGKYSRQPFLDNVFPSYADATEFADPKVDNEEITGFEAGYKYETKALKVNLNAYYTKWGNRFLSFGGSYSQYEDVAFLFTDITQLHRGLELDTHYKPFLGLLLRGHASLGDWKYDGSTPVRIRNNADQEFIDEINVELTDTKVGEAPQFSAGLGTSYDILPHKFSLDLDWNWYDNFYGFVDLKDLTTASRKGEEYQSEKLNAYSLFDLGITYKFKLGTNNMTLRGNAYNLLDHKYISQKGGYGYFYGNGLTWNFSIKYTF